jgi:hypothetical protein
MGALNFKEIFLHLENKLIKIFFQPRFMLAGKSLLHLDFTSQNPNFLKNLNNAFRKNSDKNKIDFIDNSVIQSITNNFNERNSKNEE